MDKRQELLEKLDILVQEIEKAKEIGLEYTSLSAVTSLVVISILCDIFFLFKNSLNNSTEYLIISSQFGFFFIVGNISKLILIFFTSRIINNSIYSIRHINNIYLLVLHSLFTIMHIQYGIGYIKCFSNCKYYAFV